MIILSKEYNINDTDKSTISSAALIGSMIGQLLFGLLADHIGRKVGFIITLSLVVIGSILSTFSFQEGVITISISLAAFRFLLGIGIGGEYPLSATITSESSKDSNRF
jgi:PHS family inorganic phosphate transporter-like MFS transporter